MSRLLICIGMVTLTSLSFGQNIDTLIVTKLTDNIFVHVTYKELSTGPFPANGLIILTDDGAVLIDTPWGEVQTEKVIEYVRTNFKRNISHCIVTHFHDDRVIGVPVLRRQAIPVLGGARTKELLKDRPEVQPDSIIADDVTLTIGGVSLSVFYPGRGHAPDNLVVFVEPGKVLFGGCFAKSVEASDIGNLSHADLATWPDAIRAVKKKFNPEIIVPGHQASSKGETALDHTLKLLKATPK